jgi:hypothetical protein
MVEGEWVWDPQSGRKPNVTPVMFSPGPNSVSVRACRAYKPGYVEEERAHLFCGITGFIVNEGTWYTGMTL